VLKPDGALLIVGTVLLKMEVLPIEEILVLVPGLVLMLVARLLELKTVLELPPE
jgi:hypothetical protein